VVTVCGKGSGRVSVAGLVCLKPDAPGHLFYRVRVHRGRKGERRSMSEADLRWPDRRPALIDRFLAQIGLTLESQPP
jgi:hypothetical protein